MTRFDRLLAAYDRQLTMPWTRSPSGPERVWMLIYAPNQERRIRGRLAQFEQATVASGYRWRECDISNAFGTWLAEHEYAESYYAAPEYLASAMRGFRDEVVRQVRAAVSAPEADESTVVALVGVASLFGLCRVSDVIDAVADAVSGRLLVLFPGEREGSNYRLLGARDGWNYMAIPITTEP